MARDPQLLYTTRCPLDGTTFSYDDPETVPSIMLAPDGSLIPEDGPAPEGSQRHALCPDCVEAIKRERARLGKHDWPKPFAAR